MREADNQLVSGALSSFKRNVPQTLMVKLNDRQFISSLTMESAIKDLLPATCATIYNSLQYGHSLSLDNITNELAVHFVEDGERDYKTARFTATDMMNICGPLGIGFFKFNAGRITANNRSLLEYFASKDRCFGSKKEEDWGNRLIEDGVKYPSSTPIHVDSFQYLIESRRPRVGFEMLTLLAENIQNKKMQLLSAVWFVVIF